MRGHISNICDILQPASQKGKINILQLGTNFVGSTECLCTLMQNVIEEEAKMGKGNRHAAENISKDGSDPREVQKNQKCNGVAQVPVTS